MAAANPNTNLIPHPGHPDQAVVISELSAGDPQFLHTVLCQLGLPRNPTASRTFERTSGRASLLLEAGKAFDGMKWIEQPLPSGTRPRLVLINLCSEAVRTKNPEVDIGGSQREFLRRLGIDPGGESVAHFKRQMLALSSCHMTLGMATADGSTQIDAKPIDAFQAWHTNEEGQRALWPGYIRLTAKFFENLIEHAVPLHPEAISRLQNSALALDIYSWMVQRVARISDCNGITIPWSALREQFGQEYVDPKNFRRKFLIALQKVHAAYQDARIELVPGGLKLLPSPPAVKRRTIPVALPAPAPTPVPTISPPPSSTAERARIFISPEALQRARPLAPGWDIYQLEKKFLEWANGLKEPLKAPPDKAFLSWVPKITKGKRP